VKETELIIHSARQLITCASPGGPKRGAVMNEVGVIPDGAVAIDEGKIIALGSSAEIISNFKPARIINATGKVILPGFVDPHTHAVFAGDRLNEFELRIRGASYLEILASGGGINATASATKAASEQELFDATWPRLSQMLELGATTVEIKTGYGLDAESELKMLRVVEALDRSHPLELIPTFMPAHAVPQEYTGRSDDYVALIIDEMLPAAAAWYRDSHFAAAERPFFIDVFCEEKAFDLAQSRRVLTSGRDHGLMIKAHVDEFSNLGGVGMALALGATSIDHLDTITASEIEQIAQSSTIAVITPVVNFNLGSAQYADARGLIDAGAAVALTTDFNPGSSPCASMPLTMAIAGRFCRMTPAETLNAATINAAHALGLGSMIGSLEVGKQADVLVAEVGDYRQLAYELGGNSIEMVIKSGRVIGKNE
jgi:imidazolonepropionase